LKGRDKPDSKHQVKFPLNVLRLNKSRSELLYLSFYDLLEIINQSEVTKNLIFTPILTLPDPRLADPKREKRPAVAHQEVNAKSSAIKIKAEEVDEGVDIARMNAITEITS